MPALKGGAPNATRQVLTLGGERFFVAEDPKTGARQWKSTYVPTQAGQWAPEVPIDIPSFGQGYGFSWEGLPGTYSHADGWDASAPGKLTTWPTLALGDSFTTTAAKGWMFQLGQYFYVARGRYVVKYQISDAPGTWPIAEIHDLGSANICAGHVGIFGEKAYVPVRAGVAGSLQVFHELSASVVPVTEQQTITITGTPTGGTYTLTFDGKTTAAIAYNANAAAVQAALRLIAGLQLVTVASTGTSPNFVHTVTMTGVGGNLGNASPPQMTVTDSTTGGTHNIAVATTIAGTADTWNAGPAGREMSCFLNWQNKMYAASGNEIYSVATAPLTSGNWTPAAGNGYQVGDASRDITDMALYINLLVIGKTDGVYTFDTNFQVVNELPDLRFVVDSQNAMGMEFAEGFIHVPHRSGLFRWNPGSYVEIGPNQEGGMESDLSPGWGRVAGIVPFGGTAYVAVNDEAAQEGAIASLQPPHPQSRGPVVPHMHQLADGRYDAIGIASLYTQPIRASGLTTWAADTAVGDHGWGAPSNAEADDGIYASSGNGTTYYLKGTQLARATVPAGATITGLVATVKRKAAGA